MRRKRIEAMSVREQLARAEMARRARTAAELAGTQRRREEGTWEPAPADYAAATRAVVARREAGELDAGAASNELLELARRFGIA